jgi:tripartite ATP-independent transporter DctP family solute receptor
MSFRSLVGALGLVASLALAGGASAAQKKVTFAFSLPVTSHYGAGAQALVEHVKKRHGDRFDFVLYPSTALGSERELLEGVQLGTVDLLITSTGPVGNFVPEVLVTDIPFLFRDYAHARAVLDGPIGQDLLGKFPANNMIALAWAENGFRHLTNNVRPVAKPADVEGMKVRTMENPVHLAAFRALGALPTPMAWTELPTSLQQGVVDGQENPISVIISSKMRQLQKYLSLTGHVYSPALIIMSPEFHASLTPEEQATFQEAAKVAAKAVRDAVSSAEETGVAELRAQGMDVTAEVDKAAFQARLKPAYAEYAKRFGEDQIARIANYR